MSEQQLGGEALIKYLDGDFEVIKPGTHVLCAISQEAILLEDLKYWSVARQEAYRDAEMSFAAYQKYGSA